jgi:hypothetical protein
LDYCKSCVCSEGTNRSVSHDVKYYSVRRKIEQNVCDMVEDMSCLMSEEVHEFQSSQSMWLELEGLEGVPDKELLCRTFIAVLLLYGV